MKINPKIQSISLILSLQFLSCTLNKKEISYSDMHTEYNFESRTEGLGNPYIEDDNGLKKCGMNISLVVQRKQGKNF